MMWSATCAARSIGMAKPMPMEPREPSVAMAVLTPITSPLALTSGPPELPGLIGASVCRAVPRWLPSRTSRSSALTIPEVTVPARPSGEPTASTGSPTAASAERPRVSGSRPAGLATFSTARSVVASRPTTVAGMRLPLCRTTSTVPPEATTWLLVRI